MLIYYKAIRPCVYQVTSYTLQEVYTSALFFVDLTIDYVTIDFTTD